METAYSIRSLPFNRPRGRGPSAHIHDQLRSTLNKVLHIELETTLKFYSTLDILGESRLDGLVSQIEVDLAHGIRK